MFTYLHTNTKFHSLMRCVRCVNAAQQYVPFFHHQTSWSRNRLTSSICSFPATCHDEWPAFAACDGNGCRGGHLVRWGPRPAWMLPRILSQCLQLVRIGGGDQALDTAVDPHHYDRMQTWWLQRCRYNRIWHGTANEVGTVEGLGQVELLPAHCFLEGDPHHAEYLATVAGSCSRTFHWCVDAYQRNQNPDFRILTIYQWSWQWRMKRVLGAANQSCQHSFPLLEAKRCVRSGLSTSTHVPYI